MPCAGYDVSRGEAGHRPQPRDATSHRTAELELYQLQEDTGPCIEAVHSGEAVSAASPAEILDRWGAVGEAITAAGYESVYAAPLRWHGVIIGALNCFRRTTEAVGREEVLLWQAFADVATIVVVQATELTVRQLTGRIDTALEGRTVIEQAKGSLPTTTTSTWPLPTSC